MPASKICPSAVAQMRARLSMSLKHLESKVVVVKVTVVDDFTVQTGSILPIAHTGSILGCSSDERANTSRSPLQAVQEGTHVCPELQM